MLDGKLSHRLALMVMFVDGLKMNKSISLH